MIETAAIHGTLKTLLYISPEETAIPTNIWQGKRESGYLYKDGKLSEWYWQGFTQQNGNRYIYFEPIKLLQLEALFTLEKTDFLARIRDIAELLKLVNCKRFIPQDALYLIEGGGILLLPFSIMELQITGKNSEQIDWTYEKWVRPGFRDEKISVYLLASYLYHYIAGQAPLENQDARDDSYKPTPINLYPGKLNPKAGEWIQKILNARKTDEIQDIGTWIEEFKVLYDDFFNENPIDTSEKLQAYLAGREKRAKKKRFLRKRGNILIASTLALAAIVAFSVSILGNILESPATAGLPPEEMIALYYQSQNSLDSELLGDCLDRGVKSEATNMVTYLFVTSRTRLAYEQNDGLVSAQEWLDQGRPEVDPTSIIYGITDLEITQLDEDTFLAEYDLWTPAPSPDEDSGDKETETGNQVEQKSIREELDVRLKKDYWLITEIRRIDSTIVD
ncbi:MAG: hypothetical protein ISR78_09355 [Spirochaetia bacterium]|nr:hypothetical protein [Spirochaetia bacterium]